MLRRRRSRSGPIEREALTLGDACARPRASPCRAVRRRRARRLFRRYLVLGLVLMLAYAGSGAALPRLRRLRLSGGGRERLRHRMDAHRGAVGAWRSSSGSRPSTICICCCRLRSAAGDIRRSAQAVRAVARVHPRRSFSNSAACFWSCSGWSSRATFASALAWSGVGLIAFVPLVGLAVFPLQIAALHPARACVFEYRPDGHGRLHHALPAVRARATSLTAPMHGVGGRRSVSAG